MSSIETRLQELGIQLPPAPYPKGNYVPWRKTGNLLYLSGVLSILPDGESMIGKAGEVHDLDAAYAAARICALNALASAKAALGSLDQVRQMVLLNGFVNAVPGYAESPKVINGASDLLGEVFGEAGKHARAAVAVTGLPMDATVELQLVLETM